MMYGGVDLSDYALCNCRNPMLAPLDVSARDLHGADGASLSSVSLAPLTVRARLTMTPGRGGLSERRMLLEEAKRVLAAQLFSRDLRPLALDGDGWRYRLAVVSSVSEPDPLGCSEGFDVEFFCPDPVAYGQEKSVTSPMILNNAIVCGTYETRPVFTFEGINPTPSDQKVTSVGIQRRDTMSAVNVDMGFKGGETVVIDMERRHCTVNGASADRYVRLTSDYFSLPPGFNVKDLWYSNNYKKVTVRWRDRWL